MTNIALDIHKCARSRGFRNAIVFSLCFGLLSTLGTTVRAAVPSTAPLALPSPTTSDAPSAADKAAIERLLGQWQWQDASGEKMTFVFAPKGKLFILVESSKKPGLAEESRYQIKSAPRPMQLDVLLSDGTTIPTIFEFTAKGQLRMELANAKPGEPRPTAFTTAATSFKRISNATTLPQNVQVADFDSRLNEAREQEAQLHLNLLTQAQQAYHQKKSKFATTFDEFVVGIEPETQFYRYRVIPQGKSSQTVGDRPQQVMITAQPKVAGLRSYTAGVFATTINGKDVTAVGVCASNQPATVPPAMPITVPRGSTDIQCPAGSSLLQPQPTSVRN